VTQRLFKSMRTGLTSNTAQTAADAEDARLRGRTYAIPFDAVWTASYRLIGGGLRGWSVLEADDAEGIIRGQVRGWFRRFDSRFTLRISLDRDAQTRVDGVCASLVATADLGVNARRLGRLFRELDRALEASRKQPVGGA
jgi:hypothetical protein